MSQTQQQIAARLMRDHGSTFASEAGIQLADEPGPLWQLLILAQLLSTRISSDTALATARGLWAEGWTTPAALRRSTWNQRVAALGRGGYRRYDFSTATRLDANATMINSRWGDDLRRLRDESGSPAKISKQLQAFDGIGPLGASIFLRDVQAVWPSVRPYADKLVAKGAPPPPGCPMTRPSWPVWSDPTSSPTWPRRWCGWLASPRPFGRLREREAGPQGTGLRPCGRPSRRRR